MRSGWRIAAALAGLTVAGAWTARAQDRLVISGRATTLAEQQRALRDAKVQAASARKRSEQLDRQAAQARAEADRLNARAAALAARIQESEAELRAGRARVAIIDRMIAGQQARLAAQQEPLVRLTAALQSFARRPAVLALLQPGTLSDTVHIRAAFSRILPVIEARTAALREELSRSRRLHTLSEQANRALASGGHKLAEQRVALRRLEVEKRVAARGFSSGATVEAERAMAMGEQARDIGALMAQLDQAADVRARLAALPGPLLRPARPGDAPPPREDARRTASASTAAPAYRLPVTGAIVTGMGEIAASGARSRGVTIATEPGAQIVAPAQGRVAFAGPYRGFGRIVILDHGGGWSTLITDMGRLSVGVGETVGTGAPLGTAGTDRNSAVTVELRRQGRPVDIAAMVNARS